MSTISHLVVFLALLFVVAVVFGLILCGASFVYFWLEDVSHDVQYRMNRGRR